jgi:D-alanine-D-alanine ligase
VILVCGGTSEERAVSIASAQNVARRCGDAAIWFIAPGGAVHACTRDVLLAHERPFEVPFDPRCGATFSDVEAALDSAPRDAVVFLALHGGDGENGTIQRALEARGLAFTGSGSRASELAFDKVRAKAAMGEAGVRTARSSIVEGATEEVLRALTEARRARGRLVVKPVACGSSIGLHHVHAEEGLPAVARAVADAGVAFLVEDFVRGTELTVGVVDEPGRPAIALPASEVRLTGAGAFDYLGKYLGRGTLEITPAEVAAPVFAEAQRVAVAAHRQLGCEGYSRTDLIATEDGVTYLETNTLPGLTGASFIPQQLVASGRSMEGFLAGQVELAKARRDAHRRG